MIIDCPVALFALYFLRSTLFYANMCEIYADAHKKGVHAFAHTP